MVEPAPEREVNPHEQVRQLLGVLRRGWLAIATCLGIGVLVGVALWHFLPKSYVSTAKLVMRSAWMFEAFGESKALDELPFSARARQLEDLLRSSAWVEAVLDRLEWPEWARAKQKGELDRRAYLQKVKEHITARVSSGETGERLVQVTFSWHDRALAADFCHALTDHWLSSAVDGYSSEIDRRLSVHEENLRLKQDELEGSRRSLEQFETRHRISAINQRQDSQQRHDQLRLQLDQLSGDIANVDAQVELYDRDFAAVDAAGALLFPPTLPETSTVPNDEKQALMEQALRVVAEINQLVADGYTDRYPRLRNLKEDLRRLLMEAAERPNTMEVANPSRPNPVWVDKKLQRDDLYVQLRGLQAQKVKMEADLQEIADSLNTLPEILRQQETLRADVAAKQQIVFDQLFALQPFKDKKQALARRGEGQLLPYQHLERPVPAPSPSTAIGWLALAVSSILGLGLALLVVVGKELLRTSFTSADQARRMLKLPVLGEVAPIQTAIEVRRARFVRTMQIAASITLLAGLGAAIWVCVAYPGDLPRGLVEWAMDLREALS